MFTYWERLEAMENITYNSFEKLHEIRDEMIENNQTKLFIFGNINKKDL